MPEHNETILDQILTELRALQAEVSERLLFIEQRVSSINEKAKFFSDAWADTQTQVKHFERRMIAIEEKSGDARTKEAKDK